MKREIHYSKKEKSLLFTPIPTVKISTSHTQSQIFVSDNGIIKVKGIFKLDIRPDFLNKHKRHIMNIKAIRLSFILLTIILFSSNQIFGQKENLQVNEWITNWHLLGPLPLEIGSSEANHIVGFENDFLFEFGGENDLKFKSNQSVTINSVTAKWIDYSSTDSIINLDEAISKESFIAAYAYKEIYSDKEDIFLLSLGTNDGGRLWLNGTEVWDFPGARGVSPDDDLIPVFLKKGKIRFCLKLKKEEIAGGFAHDFFLLVLKHCWIMVTSLK